MVRILHIAAVTMLAFVLLGLCPSLSRSMSVPHADRATAENLIINGGFEKEFLGWTQQGCVSCGAISALIAHDGQKSYSVDTTAVNTGTFVWQSLPEGIQDFELRIFVYREEKNAVFELVRNWDPVTGRADFVTEVNFAYPSSGTLRLKAWNTELVTNLIWPSYGWHELTIVANWSEARQEFFLDNRLVGVIQAPMVFLPEHVILGDVRGQGWRARYFFDGLSLLPSRPCPYLIYMPFLTKHSVAGNA
jgi:hypothetical protein